jgi:chromosome segregation ATPase
MGIEEYRFLTRTMKQIADCSSQLEKAKKKLPQEENRIERRRGKVKDKISKLENIESDIEKLNNRIEEQENETSKLPTLMVLRRKLAEAGDKIDPKGIRNSSPLEPVPYEGGAGVAYFVYFTFLCIWAIAGEVSSWVFSQYEYLAEFYRIEYILFLIIFPGVIALWLNRLAHIDAYWRLERWEEKEAKVKEFEKEVRPIRNDISTIEVMSVNVSRLGDLKRELRNINQNRKDLENNLAKDEKSSADLSEQISSLEEEISALWDSIGHLIPYSTALDEA